MNAPFRVADVVAHTLRAYETEFFFQVTGGDPALWLAFEDVGIRMIPCRTEPGAVYMADGYARISGKPGFAYGQHGPGAANVASALADAYWAMSPVISLTSSIALSGKNKYEYQELDQLTLHAPVTRWAREVLRVDQVHQMLRSAIRAATAPPPGPVHIEIPRDLIGAPADPANIYRDPLFGHVPSVRSAPEVDLVGQLVEALEKAERPVLIAGSGVVLSQAWDEVRGVAEALSLPIATTLGGKGAISEDHELALGVVGRYSSKTANEIVRECDVALVVGSRLGGMSTDSFTVPPQTSRVLHVDVDPTVFGHTYQETLSVQSDAKLALRAIMDQVGLRGSPRPSSDWSRKCAERVQAWKRVARRQHQSKAGALHPGAVIQALATVMRPDDILVADTGYMAAWAGVLYPIRAPGRNFLRASGSLGWALPAALGASLASPERRTVALIGDGGVAYHIAELETAVRCSIPAVVVVLNNRSLGFEYHLQKYVENRVLAHVNDFTDVDYAAVAKAFGASGKRITDLDEVPGAMQQAFDSRAPTLLDVMVDKEAIAPVTAYERVIPRDV